MYMKFYSYTKCIDFNIKFVTLPFWPRLKSFILISSKIYFIDIFSLFFDLGKLTEVQQTLFIL